MFAYSPDLVLIWTPSIGYRTAMSVVGVLALSAGVMGYFKRRSDWLERLLLVVGAILVIVPDVRGDVAGIVLIGTVVLYQTFASRGPLVRLGLARAG